ncbi:MAG: ribosome small subunit-dependent GTPase A [Alistipes sp.]|jgi:ribosome biogenesis GTPase|nr:ribosome small subunit-dependent GTPase A [Alistipes sp.]
MDGIVMRSTGSWYEVRDADSGEIFKARVRGRLRLSGSRSTNPVVVGDQVGCTVDEPGEVWIERVAPRRNYIIRRSSNLSRESHIIAANLDQAIVVATLFAPTTAPEFVDRFLVTCEAYSIPAAIVLNKTDLAHAGGADEAVRHFVSIYEGAGYPVMLTSATNGLGISELRNHLKGRTTLISGNSGVGKSTLIKAIAPGLDIRIGEISKAHQKGMHTTTFSQMYSLGGEGYIIDTPGIKGFGLIDIGGGELYHYFPDLMRVSPDCQYYNCTHTHEPGCAVIRAVDEGRIAPERYVSYLKMLEEDEKYRK